MLLGEIVHETKDEIRFRVLTTLGDAPAFAIQGEHTIEKKHCREILRKDLGATPQRLYDQIGLPPQLLSDLGRRSFPLDS